MYLKRSLPRRLVTLFHCLAVLASLRLLLAPAQLTALVPVTLTVHGSEEIKKWLRRVRRKARIIETGYGNSVPGAWLV